MVDDLEPADELFVGPHHRNHAVIGNARLCPVLGKKHDVIALLFLE